MPSRVGPATRFAASNCSALRVTGARAAALPAEMRSFITSVFDSMSEPRRTTDLTISFAFDPSNERLRIRAVKLSRIDVPSATRDEQPPPREPERKTPDGTINGNMALSGPRCSPSSQEAN